MVIRCTGAHLVVEGEDDTAEYAECPWDWEKEEIEEYLKELCGKEILENPALFTQSPDTATVNQMREEIKLVRRIIKKYKAMLDML